MKLLLVMGLVAAMFSCLDVSITKSPNNGRTSVSPPESQRVEVDRVWESSVAKQYCVLHLPAKGEMGYYTTRSAVEARRTTDDPLSQFYKIYDIDGREFVSYFPMPGYGGSYNYYPQDPLFVSFSQLLYRSAEGSVWVIEITDAMRNPGSGKTTTMAYVYRN